MFRSPARLFVIIFLLSFAIRATLLVVWAGNHENFHRLTGETGKVALSLLRDGEFGDPYMIPTGPTAHPAPVWPALLWLIYGAFGMTANAGYVRGLVAICSYSALYGLMPWLGNKLGLGARAGAIAGVAGALFPQQGLDEVLGQGVSAHASIGMALMAAAFADRWKRDRTSAIGLLLLGLGCGVAFHVAPPLLLVLLGYLAFELLWRRDRSRWTMAAYVALGAMIASAPWTWRNYRAFDTFLFIRGNFGLEFRIANQDGADADIEVSLARKGTLRHPSENLAEARQVAELGEAEYMRRARDEALLWIANHPGEFARLTLMRFIHFWCGPLRLPWLAALYTALTALALLGLWRAWPALEVPCRAALVMPLAMFPLVYYVVSYVAHYPAPLAWLLLLLAGYAVHSLLSGNERYHTKL